MAMMRRGIGFKTPVAEIVEYEYKEIKVRWKRQCVSSAEDEVHDDGLDESPEEREERRRPCKRTQALLALWRAAKMRAMVKAYMLEPSLHLPPIVGDRSSKAGSSSSGGQESFAPAPPESAPRTRRPAPRARQHNVAAQSHDGARTVETQVSHETYQLDLNMSVSVSHARDLRATAEEGAVGVAEVSSECVFGSVEEADRGSGSDGPCVRVRDAVESDKSSGKSPVDGRLSDVPLEDVSIPKPEDMMQEGHLAAEVPALAQGDRVPLTPSTPRTDAVFTRPSHRNFRRVANPQTQ
eukprot:TRINITY_DN32376_c0_g1_i1.p1 TRINITY_DN32376_c0_g1~~TRINITY_DN32376_c0_g1_i1.p1  ORF type:complete len:316 (-),score=50.27 TRINITY_DN32376_c0_g1_i1:137-1021(-)